MSRKTKVFLTALSIMFMLLRQDKAYAMHIMEGFLPLPWALFWFALCIPFWWMGMKRLNTVVKENPETKMLLAFAGAFSFVLSALKLPSINGSSSHPTGVGLGAIIFGPAAMSVLGTIVLLFQALLLAHGGLTTLGANVFSMAIVGPLVSYGIFILGRKLSFSNGISVFAAAALGAMSTYIVTALQLAMVYPDPVNGIGGAVIKFLGVFAVTQLPLALGEGFLTVMVFNLLLSNSSEELKKLNVISKEVKI